MQCSMCERDSVCNRISDIADARQIFAVVAMADHGRCWVAFSKVRKNEPYNLHKDLGHYRQIYTKPLPDSKFRGTYLLVCRM